MGSIGAVQRELREDAARTPSTLPKHDWKVGDGATDNGESLTKEMVEINPYAEGRPPLANYKLLIGAIIPRPIALVGTISKDGITNLAPFSYFQVISHDPPLFIISFTMHAGPQKDTLANLRATGGCTISLVSEHILEAANASSTRCPPSVSEFDLVGLHEAPSATLSAPRVREAVFSIEAKLVEMKEFESRVEKGKISSVVAFLEGTRFWVQKDAVDEEGVKIDPEKLRAVGRTGAGTYARLTDIVRLHYTA